jgi:predicted LPLAT superfamily acyltransferase
MGEGNPMTPMGRPEGEHRSPKGEGSPSRSPAWLGQHERGSAWRMAVIARVALRLGRPTAGVLLYPICAYFVLVSTRARRASRAYLARVLGRRVRWGDVFRHYHCFAATLLDRVFLYAGQAERFQCQWHGLDVLREQMAPRRGCLLVGAHFGSFEILRALALTQAPVRVRVLMHADRAAKMDAVLRRLNADLPAQVIRLGQPTTMLEVRAALDRGELVALLADRSLHGDRQVACGFLGAPAPFPRGPFELAALLRVPVVMFCAAYRGGRGYAIRFDALDAGDVDTRCRAFAAWLEARCREAPHNWFNFYDFWPAVPVQVAA